MTESIAVTQSWWSTTLSIAQACLTSSVTTWPQSLLSFSVTVILVVGCFVDRKCKSLLPFYARQNSVCNQASNSPPPELLVEVLCSMSHLLSLNVHTIFVGLCNFLALICQKIHQTMAHIYPSLQWCLWKTRIYYNITNINLEVEVMSTRCKYLVHFNSEL